MVWTHGCRGFSELIASTALAESVAMRIGFVDGLTVASKIPAVSAENMLHMSGSRLLMLMVLFSEWIPKPTPDADFDPSVNRISYSPYFSLIRACNVFRRRVVLSAARKLLRMVSSILTFGYFQLLAPNQEILATGGSLDLATRLRMLFEVDDRYVPAFLLVFARKPAVWESIAESINVSNGNTPISAHTDIAGVDGRSPDIIRR